MAVPKQHRSKSRQGKARMHKYLKTAQAAFCPTCKAAVLPHTLCRNCGTYQGRQVIDVFAQLTKKERKAKEKELAAREEAAPRERTPEELSKSS